MEINRTANASGNVSVAGHYISSGAQHAGRRINLRLGADLTHVVIDAILTKTMPLTLAPSHRARFQGVRLPGPAPQHDHPPAPNDAPRLAAPP